MWYAPLPWEQSDRMVYLEDRHPTLTPATHNPGTSGLSVQRWRADLPSEVFDRLEASRRAWVPVRTGAGSIATLRSLEISGGYADSDRPGQGVWRCPRERAGIRPAGRRAALGHVGPDGR